MTNEISGTVKEIVQKIEDGLQDIFSSGHYQDYLRIMARFHNYSFNNSLLIFIQCPTASLVASYGTWKKMGRYVKHGEKGIRIIAPCPYKKTLEQDKTDSTGKMIGPDGKLFIENTEIVIPMFKVVSVFDVSQTDGKPLPTLGIDELTGDVDNYAAFFHALEQVSPFPIFLGPVDEGIKGYCSYKNQRIVIRDGMDQLQTIKTVIHEITHAILHNFYGLKKQDIPKDQKIDRRTREVQAESVAFAVCHYYDFDTSEYSFPYLVEWCSGHDLKELKSSLDIIRQTTAHLIESIDGQLGRERLPMIRDSPQCSTRPTCRKKHAKER